VFQRRNANLFTLAIRHPSYIHQGGAQGERIVRCKQAKAACDGK
jgi:hypothetical protein